MSNPEGHGGYGFKVRRELAYPRPVHMVACVGIGPMMILGCVRLLLAWFWVAVSVAVDTQPGGFYISAVEALARGGYSGPLA